MVNLWPFGKSEDASLTAFEKTLSTLTTKISTSTSRRDHLRARARRLKALWTLYTVFAYILFLVISLLVTGRTDWTAIEYSGAAGGPVIIYLVRYVLTAYYEYRISSTQTYIDDLQKQREAAIEKFKTATKYNSTQAVLERYGAAPKAPKLGAQLSESDQLRKRSKSTASTASTKSTQQAFPVQQRTSLPPPPTANIKRPLTPNERQQSLSRPGTSAGGETRPPPSPATGSIVGEEFAPNAHDYIEEMDSLSQVPVPGRAQYASSVGVAAHAGSAWYDRLLDVLLGEDESKPINRIALICSKCRLVNGQAPPGVRSLVDLGKWRCGGCGAWNEERKPGDEDVEKILKIAKGEESEDPSVKEDKVPEEAGEPRAADGGPD